MSTAGPSQSFEALFALYEAQQAEWWTIADEIEPEATPYEITREQRKRMLRRGLGERLVTADELEQAYDRDPEAAEAFLDARARAAAGETTS